MDWNAYEAHLKTVTIYIWQKLKQYLVYLERNFEKIKTTVLKMCKL